MIHYRTRPFMLGAIIAGVCAVTGLLASCHSQVPDDVAEPTTGVVMSFSGMTRAAVDNTQVWLFNGIAGADRGKFHSRILQVNQLPGDVLLMSAPAGTWDIALVATDNGAGMGSILSPIKGRMRSTQPMFILKPIGGVLPSAPELLTGRVEGQTVVPNTTNTAPQTPLSRNVAQIRLTIKEPRGLNTASEATHKVSLGNIPTTLSWDGGLLPDRDNPTVSSHRMESSFTITNGAGGSQTCSTVTFLVPADKNGVTTSLLDVMVDVDLGGRRYTSLVPKQIPVAPKTNQILEVNLQIAAELEVNANILPWEEVPLEDSELANPYTEIRVSTARSILQLNDRIKVSTNGDRPAMTLDTAPAASWLTAAWEESAWNAWNGLGTLSLVTDPESYDGTERSEEVNLKLNNFTKKIKVTQKDAGPGTIKVEPEVVILSPYHSATEDHRKATIKFETNDRGDEGPFKISTGGGLWPAKPVFTVSPDKTQTVPLGGTYTLTREDFPGGFDNGDYTIFGDNALYVRNTKTLEVAKVKVMNLYMPPVADLDIECPKTAPTLTRIYEDVEIYGGSRQFTVEENVEWITEAKCVPNPDPAKRVDNPYVLSVTAKKEPDGGEHQPGIITIKHADDPDYKMDIRVEPGIPALIDPFDFFTVSYEWQYRTDIKNNYTLESKTGDVDITFMFYDESLQSPPPFYHVATNSNHVGYGGRSSIQYKGRTLIEWGGDGASGMTREEAFFNAPVVDNDKTLPRKLRLEIRATWWSGSGYDIDSWYKNGTKAPRAKHPVLVKINAFRGGSMRHGTGMDNGFYHVPDPSDPTSGRVDLLGIEYSRYCKVTTSKGHGRDRDLMCVIVYDRKTHTAKPTWEAAKETDAQMLNFGFATRSATRLLAPLVAPTPAEIEAAQRAKDAEAGNINTR